jgi:Protein of unknown function (DUF4038)/Domain of unknown function (DUF5060)
MVEFTVASAKAYADPFNDVDVDVIFSRNGESWRIPAFWRGGNRWTVRFAPPIPGGYSYRLQATDSANPDLNGHPGNVQVIAYAGASALLKHGMLRVSANHRYLEHADGTPFYWLGDTWWMGLSGRLSWNDFQTLVADRKAKGFTVAQMAAGLVPFEEVCPQDPGCGNEGGAVWEPGFARINPGYFDAADRRIQLLIDAGIVPEIEGAYNTYLSQMGAPKMKKHWRYLIARYGAYPIVWNLSDDLTDPPASIASRVSQAYPGEVTPGWTEIARYVRATDPYHHPLTVNEDAQPFDFPLQEETLTEFDQLQPAHLGAPSLANEVMQLNKRYARVDLTKPVVVGEIGYELIYGEHRDDFQRMAFWLAMLNGAAGYTYGAAPTYEVNNPSKPLHRRQYTFFTWQEGMNLPGSHDVSLSAKFLQQFPWWQLSPHPEWVTPGGTTLLEPHRGREFDLDNFDFYLLTNPDGTPTDDALRTPEAVVPGGEWKALHGTFRRPYVAGIPGKLRIVYTSGFPTPPTVLALEQGVRYHAYYWDPILGIKFDLGAVAAPNPGAIVLQERFDGADTTDWSDRAASRARRLDGELIATGETMSVTDQVTLRDGVLAVDARSDASAGLLLRFEDADNYAAAIFSAKEKVLYWVVRTKGVNSGRLGVVPVASLGPSLRLSAEARRQWGAAAITDGQQTYATPIVDISGQTPAVTSAVDVGQIKAGAVGLLHPDDGPPQRFANFEVRQSPTIAPDTTLERKLFDARGVYRGELNGPGWDDWGRDKAILLNAYRPERLPTTEDWVLVLDATPVISDSPKR